MGFILAVSGAVGLVRVWHFGAHWQEIDDICGMQDGKNAGDVQRPAGRDKELGRFF